MTDAGALSLVTAESRFRHSFEAPVARVRSDPGQPRKRFAEAEIAALAATMRERGQLQPILLRRDPAHRGDWVIVAGERRWRAARLNGWDTILAIEHDGDADVAALLENLQRVDLTPLEEARGLQRLIEGKGWTQGRAAEAIGQSKAEVSATLRILSLPPAVLDEVLTSEPDTSRNVLVELARIEDPAVRQRLLRLARAGRLTVRAIRGAREERTASPRGGAVNPPAVDRLTAALEAIREGEGTLTAADRASLRRLRQQIDRLLG
jgi:ParB family chromosome partitioning protein